MTFKDRGLVKAIPGYLKPFQLAFGTENPITIDNLAKAIAAYERTLITSESPYDFYLRGIDSAISEDAKRGLKTFQEIGCTTCHNGELFNGPTLPIGQAFYMKFPLIPGSSYDKKYELTKDLGQYTVTKKESDKNMWRVASLRNVEITAPYFHNGSVPTLEEAVREMAKVQLSRDLSDAQVKDLVAFLKSLTGKRPSQENPQLPQ